MNTPTDDQKLKTLRDSINAFIGKYSLAAESARERIVAGAQSNDTMDLVESSNYLIAANNVVSTLKTILDEVDKESVDRLERVRNQIDHERFEHFAESDDSETRAEINRLTTAVLGQLDFDPSKVK